MERVESPPAEQTLGHYELRRLLGEGGFGQVYEAWDAKLQRSIAIKRLKPQVLAANPDNLLDEARHAASLRHPAFVKIFSIDGDAEQQSIIMEYVDGSTLRQAAGGRRLSEAEVLDIVRQVAEAMEEAHAAKLIHGDLKPSNLMIEASGAVRIMDFGLARKMDAQATQSAVFSEDPQGTIAYLAPELLMGRPQSERSDVYALGVVMYELLTGERPFAHLGGLALAAAHIQSSSKMWPFPPETSAAAAELVRTMTAREPEERLSSMQKVQAAVRATEGGPAVQLASAAASTSHANGALLAALRKHSAALWVAGALALAFGVGLFTMSTEMGRKFTPFFSESAAMQAGMAALRTFDREESVQAAVQSFSAVLERHPDHAAAAAGLAMAYVLRHSGDGRDETWLQRADASAQLALRLDDQLAMGYAAQARVRKWQGKRDEALQLYERALRLDPLNVFALTDRGYLLTQMRRYDDAERAIEAAIKAYPQERMLADMLGTLRYEQGDYKAAELAFRRSIAVEPDAVIAYANLSSALIHQDRGDEALRVLQQGLQIRPSGRLYTNLGNALFNRGDYVGAAQAFEHAVSASKGNANDYLRWANLADTLRWIPGRTDASRQAYREAAELLKPQLARSPSDATLMSRMGLYSARLGEKPAAADLSRRAVLAAPDSAEVHFRAAMAFELIGDRDSALAELRIAQARGYPLNLISSEPDLIALRRDPRYHQPLPESAK